MSVAYRLALVLVFVAFAVAAAEEEPAPPPGPEPQAEPPAEPPVERPSSREGGAPPDSPPRITGDRTQWRESMWPAPTAVDWAKPVLIEFQRNWDDAVAISKETGKPILVCINMDGEIASEHYAGIRYRQPEIAELYKPYVCVIASVYRHNPRDYDDEGNRILCPRFGSCTCGEHIAIEPVIYEKYCEGKRIAPRHIAVDLNHNEVYDVYYANDTASIFKTIQEGPALFPPPKPTVVRGDRPILERVASRHIQDREAVEAAYRKGDADLRRRLLAGAAQHSDAAQLDLLRMAIFGLDVELGRKARGLLAEAETPRAIELLSDSMQVPMDAAERDRLIGALKKLGESNTLARWLAGVHSGLAARSATVDVEGWAKAPVSAATDVPDADALVWRAEYQARAAEANPQDPAPRLDLAEASLAIATEAPNTYLLNRRMARLVARTSYGDARRAAKEAEALGAKGWRVNMILALSAYYADDMEEAYEYAAKAMKDLPAGDPTWNSMALVTVFAEARWTAIKKAVKAKERWPGEWLADLHAAYAVLLRHPLSTDDQVVWHYGFLVWLGAEHRARGVLSEGLKRFWNSPKLHEKLRERLLKRRGPAALEAAYARMLEKDEDPARIAPFAGYASIVVAEHYRRQRKYEPALAAYERGIALYERALETYPAIRPSVDHAVALALAGRSRVAYQLRDDEKALEYVLASLARGPDSAGTRDGMGITPGETAQMILARLRDAKRDDLVETLQGVLDTIDPELLRPDRY